MTAKSWMGPPVSWIGGDAAVSTWLVDLHEAILWAGLVQADDTGQIDPYTATMPTTAASGPSAVISYGYLIYRFDDALQSEMPIFLKIQLGVNGTPVSVVGVQSSVQIGTGTDGAGTLTGSVTSELPGFSCYTGSYGYSAIPGQGVSRICFSEERGFFGLVYSPSNYREKRTNYAPVCLFISRTQDSSGAPTAAGVTLWAPDQGYGSDSDYNPTGDPLVNVKTSSSQSISMTSTPPPKTARSFPYLDLPPATGTDVLVQRTYHRLPAPSPCLNLVMCTLTALPEGQEFTLLSGGVTESNFVAVGHVCAFRPTELSAQWGIAMLFE